MARKVMGDLVREERLKKEIRSQFKSIRKFALDMGIPYSSLMSALDKGLAGMAFDTVMAICKRLGVSPYDFLPVNQDSKSTVSELPQPKQDLLNCYDGLNQTGRKRLVETANDYMQLKHYRD